MHHCRMPSYKVFPPPFMVLEMKSCRLILKEADEPIRMTEEKTIMQRF
jgi:hypothetical protein